VSTEHDGTTADGRTEAYDQGRMSAHDEQRREDFEEGREDEGGLLSRFRRDKSDEHAER